MRNIKRVICLVMALCLIFGTLAMSASAASVSFSDVAKDAWYHDTIIKAAEKGIVVGNADGTYMPKGTLTWAQTITFAVRLDQLRNGEDIYGSEDQTGAHWYDIYVEYALENGIIRSAPATPNGTITRADAAVIFSKVLGEYEVVNEVAEGYFTDVRAAHPAHDAIYDLAKAGVCNGKERNVFGISDNFLRSEVATIVARMAGLVDKVYIQSAEDVDFFAPLEGKVFYYRQSGSRGTTTLTMGAEGSFTGQYVRHQPAETGTNYTKGTVYLCNFTGRFAHPEAKGDYVYLLELSDLKPSTQPGNTVYQNDYRYISTQPFGLENAEAIELYLPGAYTSEMQECLINALIVSNDWGKSVPARTVNAILFNPNVHKAFVEDLSSGVTAAKLFSILKGKTFTYSSGAGGWRTTITFGDNGSFEGEFTDSNMGETGNGYPNGTVYKSSFYGHFADPTWQNDYQYSLRLGELVLVDQNVGAEVIEDGVRYVISGATGFEKAGFFTLYLPGMEIGKVPANMLSWLAALEGWGNTRPASIPCWALYNIGGETTFVSYE